MGRSRATYRPGPRHIITRLSSVIEGAMGPDPGLYEETGVLSLMTFIYYLNMKNHPALLPQGYKMESKFQN